MSIIHQALKKAAAEAESTPAQSTILKTHRAKTFFSRSRLLIFLPGFILIVAFIFSAVGMWPILRVSFSTSDSAMGGRRSVSLEPKSAPFSENRSPQSSVSSEPSREKDGEAALAEGLNFYNQGNVELANQRFARAVSLLPLSAVAHNNLGLTFRNQGNIHEAMEHYREAIRLNSDYAEAHNNLGMAYDQLGSIDQAASYYQKAIHFKPTVPEFHLNYATWLERKGDFLNARQEYQLYLSLDPEPRGDGATDQKKESIALVKARLKDLKGL